MKRDNSQTDYRVPKAEAPEEGDSQFVPILIGLGILFVLAMIGIALIP